VPGNAVNVLAVAAGASHNLALKGDGTVVAWGLNSSGQATIPGNAINVIGISAGSSHSLALKGDGTIIGWGGNGSGQITIPGNATNVIGISAGSSHSLALKRDGTVVGWGVNTYGQVTVPAGLTGVTAISAGGNHSLGLKADGTVTGWGLNSLGQTSTPTGATNVVAISAGTYHSLALKADGTVLGWGWNGYGQTAIPSSATNVVAIAAGGYSSLALKADGQVVGWGNNDQGQITTPTNLNELNIPIAVSGTVDSFNPGNYTLSYSVTNFLGAVSTGSRAVIVADTLSPMLSLSGDNPLMHEVRRPFVEPMASAMDLCSGDLAQSIVSNITVMPNVPGTYTNTYTVTDAAGHTAQTNRVVVVVTLPSLDQIKKSEDGSVYFYYTNTPGALFRVLASTNVELPLSEWSSLGLAIEEMPGLFRFTDNDAANYPARFYRLLWP
jgi:hypothetical protein